MKKSNRKRNKNPDEAFTSESKTKSGMKQNKEQHEDKQRAT